MNSIKQLVDTFQITPHQLAAFLWEDCSFCIFDCDCEYLDSLTAAQLRAFGELILAEADIKEDGGLADVA